MVYAGAACVAGSVFFGLMHAQDFFKAKWDKVKNVKVDELVERLTYLEKMSERQGQCDESLSRLYAYDPIEMKKEARKYAWYRAAARTHRVYAVENYNDDPDYHNGRSVKFYYAALKYCQNPEEKPELIYELVGVCAVKELWGEVLRFTDDDSLFDSSLQKFWDLAMHRANAFESLGMEEKALAAANEIVAECLFRENRTDALVLQSRLLIAKAERENDPEVWEEVSVSLESALINMKAGDSRRVVVFNGLLKKCMAINDLEGAYYYVNSLQRTLEVEVERVNSLMLIAELEEMQGNIEGALFSLEICAKEYVASPKINEVLYKLFEIYRSQARWEEAMGILKRIIKNIDEPDSALRFVDMFLPENGTLIREVGAYSFKKKWFKDLEELLMKIGEPEHGRWDEYYEKCLYVRSLFHFEFEDWEQADWLFAFYLRDQKTRMYLEDVLFKDLFCSVQMNDPPPQIAFRAHRYMALFARGPNSKQTMLYLLQAYYDMGLYEATLDAAQMAFLNEMNRLQQDGELSRSQDWLSTVGKIAQCNGKIGFYDRANRLFRNSMKYIDPAQTDVNLYLDWAETAAKLDQEREAIRRLKLGAKYFKDVHSRMKIRVAQDMLKLTSESGSEEAVNQAKEHLEQLKELRKQNDSSLLNETLKLYRTLIDYSFQNDVAGLQKDLLEFSRDFPDRELTNVWITRFLNRQLQKGNLEEAVADFTVMMAGAGINPETATSTEYAGIAKQKELLEKQIAIEGRIKELQSRGLGR